MKIGNLDPHSNQRYVVYEKNDNSPTLQCAMGTGGGQVPLIIVAMRGRESKDNLGRYEQKLEPNLSGTTNTITSVAKDNLVLERWKV